MKPLSSKATPEANNNESNSNELIERVPIEDTPFTAIRYDNKWFLTMGKYRLTEPTDSLEQIQEDAQRADWARVMQIMQIMIDENNTAQKHQRAKEEVEQMQSLTKPLN